MTTLLLQASARPDGDSFRVVSELAGRYAATRLDLLDYTVYPYRYDGIYPVDDQFPQLVDRWLAHDRIVFVSPVYWYSMSGPLKTFFDRISDLLVHDKATGRRLRGKRMGVVGVSNDGKVENCFFEPFALTAGYLGMDYGPELRGYLTEEKTVGILEGRGN